MRIQLRKRRDTEEEESGISLSYTDPKSHLLVEVPIPEETSIPDFINHATVAVAGPGTQIVNHLLTLRITSPDVPDLALIDLPGLARAPRGDQPEDICEQIKALYDEHCEGQSQIMQLNLDVLVQV